MKPRVLVVGLGSPDRGDDAVGLLAAREIARRATSVSTATVSGRTDVLLDLWDGAVLAVLIDATVSGAPPGSVRRLDASHAPIAAMSPRRSTHDLGAAEVIELARVLGRLPPRLLVFGIEVASCEPGAPLSAPALDGLDRAVAEVLGELAPYRGAAASSAP